MTDQLMLITHDDYNYSDGMLTAFVIGTFGIGSQLLEADTIEVDSSGVTLSTSFLDKIVGDENKGVLMMEGI